MWATLVKLAPYSTLFLRIRYSTWVARDWTWVRCRIEFCVEWHTLQRGLSIENWALTREYCFAGPMRVVFLVRIRYSTWVSRDWTWVYRRIQFYVWWVLSARVWSRYCGNNGSLFWWCRPGEKGFREYLTDYFVNVIKRAKTPVCAWEYGV